MAKPKVIQKTERIFFFHPFSTNNPVNNIGSNRVKPSGLIHVLTPVSIPSVNQRGFVLSNARLMELITRHEKGSPFQTLLTKQNGIQKGLESPHMGSRHEYQVGVILSLFRFESLTLQGKATREGIPRGMGIGAAGSLPARIIVHSGEVEPPEGVPGVNAHSPFNGKIACVCLVDPRIVQGKTCSQMPGRNQDIYPHT